MSRFGRNNVPKLIHPCKQGASPISRPSPAAPAEQEHRRIRSPAAEPPHGHEKITKGDDDVERRDRVDAFDKNKP